MSPFFDKKNNIFKKRYFSTNAISEDKITIRLKQALLKIPKGGLNFKCLPNRNFTALVQNFKKQMNKIQIKTHRTKQYYYDILLIQSQHQIEILIRSIYNCDNLYLQKGQHLIGNLNTYQDIQKN